MQALDPAARRPSGRWLVPAHVQKGLCKSCIAARASSLPPPAAPTDHLRSRMTVVREWACKAPILRARRCLLRSLQSRPMLRRARRRSPLRVHRWTHQPRRRSPWWPPRRICTSTNLGADHRAARRTRRPWPPRRCRRIPAGDSNGVDHRSCPIVDVDARPRRPVERPRVGSVARPTMFFAFIVPEAACSATRPAARARTRYWGDQSGAVMPIGSGLVRRRKGPLCIERKALARTAASSRCSRLLANLRALYCVEHFLLGAFASEAPTSSGESRRGSHRRGGLAPLARPK